MKNELKIETFFKKKIFVSLIKIIKKITINGNNIKNNKFKKNINFKNKMVFFFF